MTQHVLNRFIDSNTGKEKQVTDAEPLPVTMSPVTVSGDIIIDAGENHIGEVGGNSIQVASSTITVSESAYHANDCIGGKLTFTGAMRKSGGTGILQSIIITDASNIKPQLELILFNADPTAATLTDHAAIAFSTDLPKVIRKITISSTDYVTVGGVAIADISPGSRMLTGVGTANIYGAIMAVGTPDFVATTDLNVKLGIIRD